MLMIEPILVHNSCSMIIEQYLHILFFRDDDDDEGLILHEGVGLRLRAMEYWLCSESGLRFPSDRNRERKNNGVMLVVVETLPGQSN